VTTVAGRGAEAGSVVRAVTERFARRPTTPAQRNRAAPTVHGLAIGSDHSKGATHDQWPVKVRTDRRTRIHVFVDHASGMPVRAIDETGGAPNIIALFSAERIKERCVERG
jgi:hypothetical protein